MPLVGFTDPAAIFDDAPLSAPEIDRVREIVRLEYGNYEYTDLSIVAYRCGLLTASQNQATRYDLDQFFNQVGEGTMRMSGGSDGINLDTQRDRIPIRDRVRRRLNFESVSSQGASLVRA
jgi:hypothetical protein